uniref:Uncharacterized protein n=1 Tax=Amphimedon queenslandica TaxID=400682 RepID=A0A1X7T4C1_AMPQE
SSLDTLTVLGSHKVVHSVSNAMIIAAIHPLEYCRMFSYNTPDGPSLLQTLSLSSFHKISVSLDLGVYLS